MKSSASGLFKKKRIDLQQTPYLNWRWRIDKPFQREEAQAVTAIMLDAANRFLMIKPKPGRMLTAE